MTVKELREIMINDMSKERLWLDVEKNIIHENTSVEEKGNIYINILIKDNIGVHIYEYYYIKLIDEIAKTDVSLYSDAIEAIINNFR